MNQCIHPRGRAKERGFVRWLRGFWRGRLGLSPRPAAVGTLVDWQAELRAGAWRGCPAGPFRELAAELRQAGELEEADRIASRGVELHPNNLWLAMEHAQIAAALDDVEAKLARWRRVIGIGGDKTPAKAFKNLADCHLAAGDFQGAEEVVRRGLEIHPDDINLDDRLARIARAAGFSARAISHWESMIERHPEANRAWLHRRIGETLAAEGLLDRAEARLAAALELYPEDEKLREACARIAGSRPLSAIKPASRAAAAGLDFTAHLLADRATPFGRGTCTFPFPLNGMNQHVPAMLDYANCIAPFRDRRQAESVDVFVTWGASEHHPHDLAIELAAATGKPRLCVEYGFISSPGLAINQAPQHSIIVCPGSAYFDATRPSALEDKLNSAGYRLTAARRARAEDCMRRIVARRVTKYNHAPQADLRGRFPDDGRKRVLLVDQRYGDLSVEKGLGGPSTFKRMLEAALALPEHEVLIKLHPDAISGGQGSYFARLLPEPVPAQVTLVDFDVNPYRLFEVVDKVFVCSSQLGFEALMAGLEVHCFGVPFYAGWGLTVDRVAVPRRRMRRDLAEIFHLFYIEHSRYYLPGRGVAELEDLIGLLAAPEAAGPSASSAPEAPPAEMPAAVGTPERLRILIIIPSPRMGATGRYIQNLAFSLRKVGCDVLVLADGRCPSMDNGVRWMPLAFEGCRLGAEIREAVIGFAPHIVYENGVRSRAQRAALEVMALTGARLAMQSEDDDVQIYETHHGKARLSGRDRSQAQH